LKIVNIVLLLLLTIFWILLTDSNVMQFISSNTNNYSVIVFVLILLAVTLILFPILSLFIASFLLRFLLVTGVTIMLYSSYYKNNIPLTREENCEEHYPMLIDKTTKLCSKHNELSEN